MINTKLFLVLKSMNMDEIKRFKTFSMSPYHNTNKTITRFLKYVEKYFHTIGGKSETKRFESKNIFQKVYNNSDYKEKTFAVLRSQTFNLLEEFFTIERFADKEKLRLKFLAENYRKKNITRAYRAAYLKYEEKNLEEKNIDPHWTVHRLEILMEKMLWNEYDNHKEGYTLLLEVIEDLNVFYLHQKMRIESVKANLGLRKQIPVSSVFYSETIGKQISNYRVTNPVLDLYMGLWKLLYEDEKDITAIELFRKEFEAFSSVLEYYDKDIIYFDLQNLVINEYNAVGKKLASIVFDTYITGINNNLIDVKNQISFVAFYNIAKVGSIAKRFEEVEDFIADYGAKINKMHRSSTLTLVEAQLLEDKREENCWFKISDLMADYNPPNIFLKMFGRSKELKAYYMISREDPTYRYLLLAKIKTFKVFLSRDKKALKKLGRGNQRFAFWLQKLTTALINNKSSQKLEEIYQKIENDKRLGVLLKDWLLNLKNLN